MGSQLCFCSFPSTTEAENRNKQRHILSNLHARTPLDLFPLTPHRPHLSPLRTLFLPTHLDPILNRSSETIVLNLFIAFKVHDDVWADELHLVQPEAFRSVTCLTSCGPARVSRTSSAPTLLR